MSKNKLYQSTPTLGAASAGSSKPGLLQRILQFINPFSRKSSENGSGGGAKLFVGNLSYQAKEDELRSLFQKYGRVQSVEIVTHRRSGQSKGFAFVQMETPEDAQKALALNGTSVLGRSITVSNARSKERGGHQRSGRPRRGGGNGGGRKKDFKREFRERQESKDPDDHHSGL